MAKFEDKTIARVLILIAMEAEARPLLDALQLSECDVKVPYAQFRVFSGDYKGQHVSVVINGKDARFKVDSVGTTPGKYRKDNVFCIIHHIISHLYLYQ